MPFHPDSAADTLQRAAEAISAAWPTLPTAISTVLHETVMTHGPQIAIADSFTVVSAITALLDAFWAEQDRLPPTIRQILQAGLATGSPRYRSVTAVREAQRAELLERLVRIADFRFFKDAPQLAQALSALVQAHVDRLLPPEQAVWRKLNADLAQGGDPVFFLRAAATLLGGYPAVSALLDKGKTFTRETQVTYRGGVPRITPGAPNAGAAGVAALRPQLIYEMLPGVEAMDLTRYANVYFPSTVLVTQKDVPLIVHVAQAYAAKSVFTPEEAKITLKIGDLTIVVHVEGFEVTDGLGGTPAAGDAKGRIVKVAADQDCELVIFLLTPQSVGDKRINVYIDQFSRNILTRAFQVQVVADLTAVRELANVQGQPVAVESPVRGAAAPPPDLELRVMLSADQRRLSYMLHGGADYNFKWVGESELLPTDVRAFLQPTFERLSALAGRSAAARTADETTAAQQELADLGANLFDKLFPQALKDEYGKRIRTNFAGKSLLITSDDPWIPWEILRPYAIDDDGDVLYDDPPLCEMFRLSRWLTGRGAPDQVIMKQGVWVAPPSDLPAAIRENGYFQELHRRQWTVSLAGPLTRAADVQTRFRGKDAQLFHFACHGNFDISNPDNSMIKLEGGFLSPAQLDIQAQAGLRATKPVIFLNACHAGQIGFGLTGLGGWAEKFLACGASAFIGSLWAINDELAALFAQEFYNRLWGMAGFAPQPLGQALHEARLAIKAADPANPTWLAYVLYGDPEGQVLLGAKAE